MMVCITIGNIFTFLRICTRPIVKDGSESYQRILRVFCFFYVLGCSFRALMPRVDVERICWYDTWWSCTFIGRILATFAELSYMGQLTLVLYRISSDVAALCKKHGKSTSIFSLINTFCKITFALNFVAQSFCWLGVTTTRQIWHVYEESIWLGSVLFIAISCLAIYAAIGKLPADKSIKSEDLKQVKYYLLASIVCGLVFVMYMYFVDIPLYYNRFLGDEARGGKYFTFLEGVKDTMACKVVTHDFEMWKGDLSWITGYFSAAVWISLWLARAPRLVSTAAKRD